MKRTIACIVIATLSIGCKSRDFNSDVKAGEECKTGVETKGNEAAATLKFHHKSQPKKVISCNINVNLKLCSDEPIVSTDVGFQVKISPQKNNEFGDWVNSQDNDCSVLNMVAWNELVATISGSKLKTIGTVVRPVIETETVLSDSTGGTGSPSVAQPRILSEALKWNNKFFRFGETAQCANFVREVLTTSCNQKFKETSAGVIMTRSPWDLEVIGSGAALGAGFANSLSGPEVGERIANISDVRPGDLVFFRNTYGEWPFGTITHVGIYAGNKRMIDRPTFDGPVVHRGMDMRLFVGAVRVHNKLCP